MGWKVRTELHPFTLVCSHNAGYLARLPTKRTDYCDTLRSPGRSELGGCSQGGSCCNEASTASNPPHQKELEAPTRELCCPRRWCVLWRWSKGIYFPLGLLDHC